MWSEKVLQIITISHYLFHDPKTSQFISIIKKTNEDVYYTYTVPPHAHLYKNNLNQHKILYNNKPKNNKMNNGEKKTRPIGCEFAGILYSDGATLPGYCTQLRCRNGQWTTNWILEKCCEFSNSSVFPHKTVTMVLRRYFLVTMATWWYNVFVTVMGFDYLIYGIIFLTEWSFVIMRTMVYLISDIGLYIYLTVQLCWKFCVSRRYQSELWKRKSIHLYPILLFHR